MECETPECPYSDVHVYVSGHGRSLSAFCSRCDLALRDASLDLKRNTFALLTPDAPERYAKHLAYRRARATFVQTYHDGLACHRASKGNGCSKPVTRYYFSSGETRPLCLDCMETVSIMRDSGTPISEEYYRAVYTLK